MKLIDRGKKVWHYFTVMDEFTGLDRAFRYREGTCGYCGRVYLFEVYDVLRSEWAGLRSFFSVDDGVKYCRGIDFRALNESFLYRF